MIRLLVWAVLLPFALVAASGVSLAQTLEQLYQAAKKDGTVTVATAPNVEVRNALIKVFSARFPDVKAEISGMPPPALVAKLSAEARAGVYSLDVIIGGNTAAYEVLKPAKLLGPLDPWLVTAEAKDQSKWRGGKFTWGDDQHMTLALLGQSTPVAVINTDLVKPGEISSDKDLLDPKWKGKLISANPLVPGPSNAIYQAWYGLHGPDYLKKLVAQDIVLTKDLRQLLDFVAKGQYAVALGPSSTVAHVLMQKGVTNIKPMGSRDWTDPLLQLPGFGALMIPAKVPHAAATKLFVNWLLTREGQTALSLGNGTASLRVDAPLDHVPAFLQLFDDAKYIDASKEEFYTGPTQNLMKELLLSLGWK